MYNLIKNIKNWRIYNEIRQKLRRNRQCCFINLKKVSKNERKGNRARKVNRTTINDCFIVRIR